MTRFGYALALTIAFAATLRSAPVPKVEPEQLPKGATARLGTNVFRGPQAHSLTFSADGRKLLGRGTKTGLDFHRDDKSEFSAWDADTGKALKSEFSIPPGFDKFPEGPGRAAVRSVLLNDRIVWCVGVRGSNPEVIITEFGGKVLHQFEVEGKPNFGLLQLRNDFAETAVSPNGRYLATTFGTGQAIAVYDLTTGKEVFNLENKQKGRPQVFFPRGRDVLFVKVTGKPIRRFDMTNGKELAELVDTDENVTQVAESTDGKWVVSGNRYVPTSVGGKAQPDQIKVLEIRDGVTGKVVGKLDIAGAPEFFAFIGGESLLVLTGQPRPPAFGVATFSRWNVSTRKREWEAPGAGHVVAISPDNKRFASAGQQRVFLFSAETGERLVDPSGHAGPVEWIGFSADGKTVTTAGPGEVITWAATGQRKQTVLVPELRTAEGLYLYHNRVYRGNELAWPGRTEGEPHNLTIFGWDREKNAIGWKFAAAPAARQLGTPDGKRVVCVRPDPKKPADDTVTVYDGPTGKQLGEWSCPRPKAAATAQSWPRTISGEGRFVVVGGDSPVLILDAETGKEHARVPTEATNVRTQYDPAPWVAVSADGSKLAVSGRTKVEVYDVKSGKLQATYVKEFPPFLMKFSPDAKTLVMWRSPSLRPSPVLVWEFEKADAAPKSLTAEPWAESTCVAFSPDGKTLAVGYNDGTTLLWDLAAK